MSYRVNEMFFSIQGEGGRSGSANVFVRFSGCNLQCTADVVGFDCDTEFTSGVDMTADEVLARATALMPAEPRAVIFTGGEPLLQLDQELVDKFLSNDWQIAIETNGTVEPSFDKALSRQGSMFICCSPKTAEHTLRVNGVDELRYVRAVGQGIPKPSLKAALHYISPAHEPDGTLRRDTLEHCIKICKENPRWRLSVQQHKGWRVR